MKRERAKSVECWAPVDKDGKIIIADRHTSVEKPNVEDGWFDEVVDYIRVRITEIPAKASKKGAKRGKAK